MKSKRNSRKRKAKPKAKKRKTKSKSTTTRKKPKSSKKRKAKKPQKPQRAKPAQKTQSRRKLPARDKHGRFVKKRKRLRDKLGRFKAKPKRDKRGRFVATKKSKGEKEVFDFFDKKKAEIDAKRIIEQAKREAEEIRRVALGEFSDAEKAARFVADYFGAHDLTRGEQIQMLTNIVQQFGGTYDIKDVSDWYAEFLNEDVANQLAPREIYSTLLGSPPNDIGVAA